MGKTVVILCDGQFPKTEYPRHLLRTADFSICCDGALMKYLRNSKSIFGEERIPDLVIGDMDTLSASMQTAETCPPEPLPARPVRRRWPVPWQPREWGGADSLRGHLARQPQQPDCSLL